MATSFRVYLQKLWHMWRRSFVSFFSQQRQLFFGSILLAPVYAYRMLLQYPGVAVVAGLCTIAAWVNTTICPVASIAIVAVSMTLMHPRILHMATYAGIRSMLSEVRILLTQLWHSHDGYQDVTQGRFLREVSMLFLLHTIVWGMCALLNMPHAYVTPWHYLILAVPVVPFICCSLLDMGYTAANFLRAMGVAFRIFWYQLPVCLSGSLLIAGWFYTMHHVSAYGFIFVYASIPLCLSVWYTIYLKAVYEQFDRVYQDMYVCDPNPA